MTQILGVTGWALVAVLIGGLLLVALFGNPTADDTEPMLCGCGHGIGRHNTGCDRCGCRDWRGRPV